MDADVTESAGTPAEPDRPAEDEPPTGASGRSDAGAAGAAGSAAGGAGGTSSAEPGTDKPAASEPSADKTGADKTGASEAGASEAGASEAGASEAGASEAGASEAGADKTAASETGADKPGTADASQGEDGTDSAPQDKAAAETADGTAAAAEGLPGHAAEAAPVAETAADDDGEAASVGTTADLDGTAARDIPPGSDTDADTEPPNRKHHWLRWVALGTSLVLLAAAAVGWWFYRKLDGNITTDTTAAAELETYEKERPTPVALDAQNILLLGSDTRSGDNSKYGRDDGGSQRSDTTILLHIAADRRSATAMSIPRDLMVSIPSCRKPDGTRTKKQFSQFNWAFEFGGTACTIRTVERFTGIRVDHHMVVDFSGFKDMVDAVDGVEVCLKEPIDDADAHLRLPAGKQTLNGEQALGFVRARKSIGNGSDTERMDRQQQFLAALVKKMQSNGVMLNPTRLYPVLDAATKSLTTDPGLDSLRDLYDLTRSLRSIPTEKVQFLTVPRQPYAADPNRDELVEPESGQLFKRLREDKPVTVVTGDKDTDSTNEKPDDSGPGSPSPTPTFSGTNAAAAMCK
ncbi:LCP family protein [Streptomyces lunaelactis]|nr:LCP family protein [Streptomyces lunaelactis]NUK38815.1 LCP family protein [Streptomyces lunaelactis]NUK45893.1 LCP family protein [Streptomyces lunaelactis]NUL34373.1 LCP family protein [Streptomyces lunaelactis]